MSRPVEPPELPDTAAQAPASEPPAPFWRSRAGAAWLVIGAVAGWYLWAEHRAHLLGALPYLLLLACPLMHVFMHRGHHHHHATRDRSEHEQRH